MAAKVCPVLPAFQWSIRASEILSQLVSLRDAARQRIEVRKCPDSVATSDAAAPDPEILGLRSEDEITPASEGKTELVPDADRLIAAEAALRGFGGSASQCNDPAIYSSQRDANHRLFHRRQKILRFHDVREEQLVVASRYLRQIRVQLKRRQADTWRCRVSIVRQIEGVACASCESGFF